VIKGLPHWDRFAIIARFFPFALFDFFYDFLFFYYFWTKIENNDNKKIVIITIKAKMVKTNKNHESGIRTRDLALVSP
jgi:hypothetical protein